MTASGRKVITPDFDALYASDSDPWSVESSWYEQRKLAVLLASLPRERYSSLWEPGCGPGITTVALADRTEELVASDASEVAVALARRRCSSISHVRIEHRSVDEGRPDAPIDLVVAAEFLYYVADLSRALDALWSATASGSQLAFMHWAHQPHDAYLAGNAVHHRVAAFARWRATTLLVAHVEKDFRLDIYEVP